MFWEEFETLTFSLIIVTVLIGKVTLFSFLAYAHCQHGCHQVNEVIAFHLLDICDAFS